MSVIAEFTIHSQEFVLGQVLARDPTTHVEMERVVPASGLVMPYLWARGAELTAFETSVRSSPYVDHLRTLDRLDDATLYRVEWGADVESLIYGMSQINATILEAYGNEEWIFRVRFESHDGLAEFHNFCSERGISSRLTRVYKLSDEHKDWNRFDLTESQRNALVAAVEDGYFDVPKRTTLKEIGKKLDISEQSASENIRRGAGKVLRSTLLAASTSEFRDI